MISEIGLVQLTSYPNVSTHKGMEQAVENYLKWVGGFAQNTPTIGTPKYRQTMVGGKLVKEIDGYHRTKGGRGKQDIDCIYKGVNFKCEIKVKNDTQKEDQKKYQKRVEQAGGIYRIVHTMFDLYNIIDTIDRGESLTGKLFNE